jgi:UDP:flavonoid glycosyltransferase YjiC (YdhE family)
MGSIDVAAPALEAHRAGIVDELRQSPYVTRFPTPLDPSPFPHTFRFSEPEPDVGPATLPDWWDGSRAPLLYLTFGTVLGHMTMATDVYRIALRAVADLPVRVLLTTGRKLDRSQLGPAPANVHVEAWIDQRDALAAADLVVCHGGSGTVFGALASGVPTVVVPVFADQFENGRRVAESGAGLTIAPQPDARDDPRVLLTPSDSPRITNAITAALESPSLRREARRIAEQMAAEPSVDDLLRDLLAGAIPG